MKKNPRISAPKLAAELARKTGKNVNPEKTRNCSREHGYNGRVSRRKLHVNPVNRKKRLQYAKNHIDKDEKGWGNVIFVGKKKFNIFGSDGSALVWRKPNEELKNCKTLRQQLELVN